MLAVDVGGTFTDVVAVDDGRISVTKVPTDPQETERAVLEGASVVGAENRNLFNHASTAGLNAIITRRLPKIAFLTTFGHRDILDMGRTWRPLEALTDPNWRRPFGDARAPLVPRYLRRGIKERTLADGSELIPLDEEQARGQLEVLRKCDVHGVAICLINAYVNSNHEIRLRELVRDDSRERALLHLLGGITAGQGVRARLHDADRRLHEDHLLALHRSAGVRPA